MGTRLRIDVWSDYVCPFCYLEQPVLKQVASEHGREVNLQWRAFELRPEPLPTLDPDGEYLHAVWNRAVYPMARIRGMKLRLPPVQPRSRRAFEATEFARANGRFDEMHEALFRSFFQEGQDLSSLSVLLQIAATAGLNVEELQLALETERYCPTVLRDEELADELGITGVPTIVLTRPGAAPNSEGVLSGAAPYELLQGMVTRLLEE